MIDDAEYQRVERVESELSALIDRADKARLDSGELSIEQVLNGQAERKRSARRRHNKEAWINHRLGLAESFRRAAREQEQEVADLLVNEGEETTP